MTAEQPEPGQLAAAFLAALPPALDSTGFRLETPGPGTPAQAIARHPRSPAWYRISLDLETGRPDDDIGTCADDTPTGRVHLTVAACVPGQPVDQLAGLWLTPPLARDPETLAAITASTITAHHNQPEPGTHRHFHRPR